MLVEETPGRPPCSVMTRCVHLIDPIGKYYDLAALGLAMGILGTMIPLVCFQVFFRYVLNEPFTWSEELTTYLFAWLIFTGATVTVRRNEVPALHIIVESLPPRLSTFVANVADLLALVISAIMLWNGAISCIALMRQASPAMQIPMGIPSLIMPLAGAGLCLHCLRRVLGRWADGTVPLPLAPVAILAAAGIFAIPMYLVSMDWEILGLVLAVVFGFAIGMPVAFSLIWGVSFVLLLEQQPLMIIPQTMFNASSNFILTAIPFFMFTGAVMEIGGLAERLVVLAAS